MCNLVFSAPLWPWRLRNKVQQPLALARVTTAWVVLLDHLSQILTRSVAVRAARHCLCSVSRGQVVVTLELKL